MRSRQKTIQNDCRTASILWAWCLLWLTAGPVLATDYLDESRSITETPQSTTERFTFNLEEGGPYPHIHLDINMSRGRADLRILGPTGRQLNKLGAGVCTVDQPIPRAKHPGLYDVEVTTADAIGTWHLRIYGGAAPPEPAIGPGLVAGFAMILIAGASVAFWRSRTGVGWRWFWAGAAVWAVAVAVKFAIAIPLHKPLTGFLKASLPTWAYLTTGAVYGGLMTGITEVLFTLIAALIWRQMAATAARGVAVGVGAGAFEAALLGIVAVIGNLASDTGSVAWSVALAPAFERIIAILCHTATRALVLLAVARRRWLLFWYGFLLLSGVDAVATVLHLSGRVHTMSPWLMEALVAPFGLLSIPITIWCCRRWPSPASEVDSADPSTHLQAEPD